MLASIWLPLRMLKNMPAYSTKAQLQCCLANSLTVESYTNDNTDPACLYITSNNWPCKVQEDQMLH